MRAATAPPRSPVSLPSAGSQECEQCGRGAPMGTGGTDTSHGSRTRQRSPRRTEPARRNASNAEQRGLGACRGQAGTVERRHQEAAVAAAGLAGSRGMEERRLVPPCPWCVFQRAKPARSSEVGPCIPAIYRSCRSPGIWLAADIKGIPASESSRRTHLTLLKPAKPTFSSASTTPPSLLSQADRKNGHTGHT